MSDQVVHLSNTQQRNIAQNVETSKPDEFIGRMYVINKIIKLRQANRPYNFLGKKVLMYSSKGEHVNYNWKIVNIYTNKTVICQDFAEHYIRCSDTSPSTFFTSVQDPETIRHNACFALERYDDSLKRKTAKVAHYFHIKDLPIVIEKLVINHWKDREYKEYFRFCSHNHMMAIRIKNKPNNVTTVSIYTQITSRCCINI